MSVTEGHKPDCGCPVCRGKDRTAQREAAEAEQQATSHAVARALLQLMSRGELSGPDALRNLIGSDDALRVLRMAGLDAEQAAAGWESKAPSQISSSSAGSPWTGDPAHSPEAMRALNGHVETDAEGYQRFVPGSEAAYFETVAALTAARDKEKSGHQAGRQVLWTDRDGQAVFEGGPDGRPMQPQRSVVHADIPGPV